MPGTMTQVLLVDPLGIKTIFFFISSVNRFANTRYRKVKAKTLHHHCVFSKSRRYTPSFNVFLKEGFIF